jgi:hypothetical protein
MRNNKLHCTKCNKEVNSKIIKRIHGRWLCGKCYSNNRKQRREELKQQLRQEGVIGKRRSPQEMAEAREKARLESLRNPQVPKIRGAKPKRNKIRRKFLNPKLGITLTLEERQILCKLYVRRGNTFEEAKEKVKKINNHLSQLVKRLREQRKTEKEIKTKFEEEFAKLTQ